MDISWSNLQMRGVFYTLLVTAGLMASWIAFPSTIFFQPTVLEIEGAQVRVFRTFPSAQILGMPFIRYTEIIRPIDGSTPCADKQAFRYVDNDKPYAEWGIEHWANRCLERGSYLYSVAWSPYLFDLIPLRPIEMTQLVTVR